ncbi:MAG: prephenate dehydrogenase/arogenate dehydrogenase family protein [Nitrospinae bacterium]|nr:prephenate dehydrogenase/arogenate dehydrogenase family protein [Nitrospinota bacterium]
MAGPDTAPLFRRAVIAGVGLIGGSLALAGKRAGMFGRVIGVGRGRVNLEEALRLGLVDEITQDMAEAAKGADFVFAAAPVESIAQVILAAAPHVAPDCVMTDGGSVKAKIVAYMEEKLPSSVRFVGGHPIAGKETSGAAAAGADLFKGRYTILTPTERTNPEALALVRALWRSVGAEVETMTPAEHDHALAFISHLPHVAAFALVDSVMKAENADTLRRYVAGGFKDTTRIAASDPVMWRDIFTMNRDEVLKAISEYEASLARLKCAIDTRDAGGLHAMLENIARARREIDG